MCIRDRGEALAGVWVASVVKNDENVENLVDENLKRWQSTIM